MNAPIFSLSPSTQWAKVRLFGPDARDFLHRITTARARGMNPGDGTWACILTSQGKIRASFVLWCEAEDQFSMEIDPLNDGSHLRRLLEAIDQFTFAEKMTLESGPTPVGEQPYWIRFDSSTSLASAWKDWFPQNDQPSLTPSSRLTQVTPDGMIRVHCHGDSDFGGIWVSLWSKSPLAGAIELSPEKAADWHQSRIQKLRPWPAQEISEDVNPLEIGLPDSVAENKGCYPGQEVIEKIAAIGSPAKRLIQVEGPLTSARPHVGEKLFQGGTEVGTLTSIHYTDENWTALALGRKTVATPGVALQLSTGDSCEVRGVAPYLVEGIR